METSNVFQRMRSIALVALLVLIPVLLSGQGIVTGTISGTVTDQQQAVIAGATIRAVHTATNAEFTAVSDSSGYFQLKQLPIGAYTVTVDMAKFVKLQLMNVAVETNKNTVLNDVILKVGATNEVVNVEATQQLIESTSSQVGGSFDAKTVNQLPAATGGTFDRLALFIPGMARNSATNASNTNGTGLSSNGLRGRSNNFQIDGQANNDNSVGGPSIFLGNSDVLGEFQVVTNNFGAEYGRSAGSVVNYVTKSGTNQFHGSAFEYYYGNWSFSHYNGDKNPVQGYCPKGVSVGTATKYTSSCSAPLAIAKDVDNRFGGTVGGPILKNKAWFFASYQGERVPGANNASTSSLFPTPTGLTTLATAFPNNPAVAALKAIGPYAVTAGNPQPFGNVQNLPVTDGTNTVTVPFSGVSRSLPTMYDDKQITGRGDWQITDKDRFFARYIFQKTANQNSSSFGTANGSWLDIPAQDQQIGLDYTRSWTNSLMSQLRFSYSRVRFFWEKGAAYPNCDAATAKNCPTGITFSDATQSFGSFGLANNMPQGRLINNTQYQTNNTLVRGKHTFKFGGEYDRQRSPNVFLPNVNGTFTFASVGSGASYLNAYSQFIKGAANCPTGAALTYGYCSQLSLTQGSLKMNFFEPDGAVYFQDDWRIKDNLTLQLGLRWDYYGQAVNLFAKQTAQNVANGLWSSSAPSSVTLMPKVKDDLNNFGPNVGFAYTPHVFSKLTGEGKTVIRGGFRVAYDSQFYNMFLNVGSAAPVVNAGTIYNVPIVSNPIGSAVQTAYLPSIPTGGNPGLRNQTRVADNFHNPYTELWSFGIERQINNQIAFETRYAGNHAVGQFQTVNGNPVLTSLPSNLLPAGVTPCADKTAPGYGRLNCNFTNLRIRNNGAFSEYNGWQNELRIRNYHNLSAGVSFTWSKAMDNVSEVYTGYAGNVSAMPQNPFDPSAGERGVAAQSFPIIYTTWWAYEFPWFKDQRGFVGHLLGGIGWSGNYQWQSGAPFIPYQAAQNAACDTVSANAFNGGYDMCRPIAGNSKAPYDTVGRYVDATHMVTVSNCATTSHAGQADCPYVTPNDVRFILNNTFADNALCGGNPFACSIRRNVYRGVAYNRADMSMTKNIKIWERVRMQLRFDAYNVFNRQQYTNPGLSITSRNLTGITTAGLVPGSFGNYAFATGSNRSAQLTARIEF